MPWNKEKITKKVSKWIIFYVISFLIANIFLAYLIGSDELLKYVSEGPQAHLGTITPLIIFSFVFYFIFAWFREQVCIIACPYGRLQGVLLDNQSIVVAYDHKRGEAESGRKKFRKNEDRDALGHGDCIDCSQCVHVCPTGIDIRNGTQLECVNCTACIDACDDIMEKVNLPKGLIRYASEDNITKKAKFQFTPRLKAYTGVLTILVGLLVGLLFIRSNIEADLRRLPGYLYQTTEDGSYRNVYSYKVLNKTTEPMDSLNFRLLSHKGTIKVVTGNYFSVKKADLTGGTLFIDILPTEVKEEVSTLEIAVYKGDKMIEKTTTNFMGPRSFY
jgi:cytochrome c oxidase accessory protein FixG